MCAMLIGKDTRKTCSFNMIGKYGICKGEMFTFYKSHRWDLVSTADFVYEEVIIQPCLIISCKMYALSISTTIIVIHFAYSRRFITRTTFETPKYPRQPRDHYTAQIVNTLELSAPHQIELKKPLQPLTRLEMFFFSNSIFSLVKFLTTNTCTYVAAKNGRTVKQSHCETV